jgi:hypothetical protein
MTLGSKRDRGVAIKPGHLQGIVQHDSGRGVDAILLLNLMSKQLARGSS